MRVPEIITSDWVDVHRGKKVSSWLWPFGEKCSAENRGLAISLRRQIYDRLGMEAFDLDRENVKRYAEAKVIFYRAIAPLLSLGPEIFWEKSRTANARLAKAYAIADVEFAEKLLSYILGN